MSTRNGKIVHYVYRGGKPNDMTSECGKDMETPNASYSTSREKVTCKKCLRLSLNLPDPGGSDDMMIRKYHVELEVDCRRGVIYAHDKSHGVSVLRICGVPMNAMRGLASTPLAFVPQMDLALRDNLQPLMGVANLAMARHLEDTKPQVKRKAKPTNGKVKTKPRPVVKKSPPKPKKPKVRFRIYVEGVFICYSDEKTAAAAVAAYRKTKRLKKTTSVTARMFIQRG